MEDQNITLPKATAVSARIWCDQDMEHLVMDPELCTKIAKIIYDAYN